MKLKNIDFIKATIERQRPKTGERGLIENQTPQIEPETDERRILRYEHLANHRFEPFDSAKERILGHNDLMPVNYLLTGYLSAIPVCRIHIRNESGRNEGFGTGFLVSPTLLLTNHHVLESPDMAEKSYAEFNFQYRLEGIPAATSLFKFQPGLFFTTHPDLDFTLVALSPVAHNDHRPIADFGYLYLNEHTGKALVSEYLSIIQHPGGGYKQIAMRENRLMTSPPGSHFITYSTDTTQGSSGSAVFNDQWQVVALHHSGVPRMDSAGNYLCKDGTVWKPGMEENLLDWLSNEGVRISSVLDWVKTNHAGNALIDEMLEQMPFPAQNYLPQLQVNALQNIPNPYVNLTPASIQSLFNQQKITLPVELTIHFKTPETKTGKEENIHAATDDRPENDPGFEVKKSKKPDYSNRNGYDSAFLPHCDFCIETELLTEGLQDLLAPLLNPLPGNRYRLDYTNFSVYIHKHRKLCLMTAVNIDGNLTVEITRENTPWILDPRMSKIYQTGPAVYAKNDLDRGHLVKRLDPVWGTEAELANDDTFHFTNSAPQHKNLNQKTWLSLENYIFKNALLFGLKISVFTGPVFGQDDIPYRGVLLPLQFWKVVAMIKTDGTPSVSAYLLKQPDEIDDFRTTEGISEDGFGQFKTYQVSLKTIAGLTQIPFDRFSQYDPMATPQVEESVQLLEILDAGDLRL